MMNGFLIAFLALLLPSLGLASSQVVEERLYHHFKLAIESSPKRLTSTGFTSLEQSLYVDALWSSLEENSTAAKDELAEVQDLHFDLIQRLRLGILRIHYGLARSLPKRLSQEINSALLAPKVSPQLVYLLGAHAKEIERSHPDLMTLARTHSSYQKLIQSNIVSHEGVVQDLWNFIPETAGVKVYMFCRQNRLYPCLMAMRDERGEVVRKQDGSIWTHQALAASSRGLPSHVTNGNTPAGVWAINSVMPYADQQTSFGKFRRLIIEFIPKSENEEAIKELLPISSHNENWWQPTVVARDVGRNLFRIHGTLRINPDPTSPYYPFRRTSGCIAQRENTYEGVTYQDQRDLLDAMMRAMNLAPVYENETLIKGVLFLIEIGQEERAVTESDLFARGIQ